MLRWLTSGESHGPALVGVLEGLPAGVEVVTQDIQDALARRRLGYGRGARMKFEQDEVRVLAGLRHGLTQGGPVAIEVGNTEWPKWVEVMSADPVQDAAVLQRARNVMTLGEGESTGRRLLAAVLAAGAQALQRPVGALAAGLRADVVVLDTEHPDLAARSGDLWLDAWIFAAGQRAVKTVLIGGETVVEAGRHGMRPAIEARFKGVVAKLVAG